MCVDVNVLGACRHVAQGEEEVEETPAEILYLGMLPNLSQFVVSGPRSSSGFMLLSEVFVFSTTSRVLSASDRPPETAAGCGSDLQGQDRLH